MCELFGLAACIFAFLSGVALLVHQYKWDGKKAEHHYHHD